MTARRVEPGNPDPIAFLHYCYSRSDGSGQSDGLMAGNKREIGLHGPVAMCGVKIGVAHAACLRFDYDLTWTRRRNIPFSKHQGRSEPLDNCGMHLCHCLLPFFGTDSNDRVVPTADRKSVV